MCGITLNDIKQRACTPLRNSSIQIVTCNYNCRDCIRMNYTMSLTFSPFVYYNFTKVIISSTIICNSIKEGYRITIRIH